MKLSEVKPDSPGRVLGRCADCRTVLVTTFTTQVVARRDQLDTLCTDCFVSELMKYRRDGEPVKMGGVIHPEISPN